MCIGYLKFVMTQYIYKFVVTYIHSWQQTCRNPKWQHETMRIWSCQTKKASANTICQRDQKQHKRIQQKNRIMQSTPSAMILKMLIFKVCLFFCLPVSLSKQGVDAEARIILAWSVYECVQTYTHVYRVCIYTEFWYDTWSSKWIGVRIPCVCNELISTYDIYRW